MIQRFLCAMIFLATMPAFGVTGVAFVHGTGQQSDALNDYWRAGFVNSVRQGLPDSSKFVVVNCDFEQFMWDSRAAGCLAGDFAVRGQRPLSRFSTTRWEGRRGGAA